MILLKLLKGTKLPWNVFILFKVFGRILFENPSFYPKHIKNENMVNGIQIKGLKSIKKGQLIASQNPFYGFEF